MTGNAMRFGEHFELNEARVYFSHLFTFSVTSTSIPQSGMFALHFLLAQVLIIFIPFSKILHFGGIFLFVYVLFASIFLIVRKALDKKQDCNDIES